MKTPGGQATGGLFIFPKIRKPYARKPGADGRASYIGGIAKNIVSPE